MFVFLEECQHGCFPLGFPLKPQKKKKILSTKDMQIGSDKAMCFLLVPFTTIQNGGVPIFEQPHIYYWAKVDGTIPPSLFSHPL